MYAQFEEINFVLFNRRKIENDPSYTLAKHGSRVRFKEGSD